MAFSFPISKTFFSGRFCLWKCKSRAIREVSGISGLGKAEPVSSQNTFGKCPGFLVWVNKTRTSPETFLKSSSCAKSSLTLSKSELTRAPNFGVAFVSAGRARWLKESESKSPEFAHLLRARARGYGIVLVTHLHLHKVSTFIK